MMEKRQFVEAIEIISKHFGKQWSVESVSAAYEQVSTEALESLLAAQKRVYIEFPSIPQPPIGRIISLVTEEGKKRRMQQGTQIENNWNEQKVKGKYAPGFFFDAEKKNKHGKEAIFLMMGRLEGRLNDEAYIACLHRMSKEYPGCGWDDLANEVSLKPARAVLRESTVAP
jgi:hypothetical protein